MAPIAPIAEPENFQFPASSPRQTALTRTKKRVKSTRHCVFPLAVQFIFFITRVTMDFDFIKTPEAAPQPAPSKETGVLTTAVRISLSIAISIS